MPPDFHIGRKSIVTQTIMPEYIWQERFQAALTETNPVALAEHIQKARLAMRARLEVLAVYKHSSAKAEYRAITDAESQLKVLERSSKLKPN